MIKVTVTGFDQGAAFFARAARRFRVTVREALQAWGDEQVVELKNMIYANAFNLPPKAHDNGQPPLVDSGKYAEGYAAVIDGDMSLGIVSEGMNDHMSNADLGELLEYGNGDNIPARPHLRPFAVVLQRKLPELGERISRGLLGS